MFINSFIYRYGEARILNTFAERDEGHVALVGLVRVSTKDQETARQHDALGPICVRVFEERRSGKLKIDERPGLQAALDYHAPRGHAHRAGGRSPRPQPAGLIVLNDLFSRGIAVKILEGIAAGEHTERNLILDMALALAEDRRRDIVRKTRNGLDAARARGRVGRPRVVDADKRTIILARHADGESIRTIARATKLSVGTVHNVLTDHRATNK
ncbi:recombinase family protein [Amycolatopsis sp. NPDC049253]|uniref:recombinase family protein n=1 Tax=Amycolatopsis sp. NPDC049253 TaxID=3155274 RepID=UPI0034419100